MASLTPRASCIVCTQDVGAEATALWKRLGDDEPYQEGDACDKEGMRFRKGVYSKNVANVDLMKKEAAAVRMVRTCWRAFPLPWDVLTLASRATRCETIEGVFVINLWRACLCTTMELCVLAHTFGAQQKLTGISISVLQALAIVKLIYIYVCLSACLFLTAAGPRQHHQASWLSGISS